VGSTSSQNEKKFSKEDRDHFLKKIQFCTVLYDLNDDQVQVNEKVERNQYLQDLLEILQQTNSM